MKVFAAVVMCIALYLLYRIAYPPKSTGSNSTRSDLPLKNSEEDTYDVVGKSRFVSVQSEPTTAKSTPTTTTVEKIDDLGEAATTFVSANPNVPVLDTNPVIPIEDLPVVFAEKKPMKMPTEEELTPIGKEEIGEVPLEPEPKEDVEEDTDEEEEGFSQDIGSDGRIAGGMTFEEMESAKRFLDNPVDDVPPEAAKAVISADGTDWFENLILKPAEPKKVEDVDMGIMEPSPVLKSKIAALIEKHTRNVQPVETVETVEAVDQSQSDKQSEDAIVGIFLGN